MIAKLIESAPFFLTYNHPVDLVIAIMEIWHLTMKYHLIVSMPNNEM